MSKTNKENDIKQKKFLERLAKIKKKCSEDYSYYAEKYMKTWDNTSNGFVPFKMYKQQSDLVKNLKDHQYNIVNKGRQTGISTTSALFCSAHMLFENNRKVAIVAHKRDGSENFLEKVIEFIEQKPFFLDGISILSKSKSRVVLSNGSEARAFASSAGSLRGFTPTMLVFDEAAHLEGDSGVKLWTGTQPSLATGGKAIVISTPLGMDQFFYKQVSMAKKGENNFVLTEIYWWLDERYNKNVYWLKKDDLGDITEKLENQDPEKYKELYKQGYEPESPWFIEQKKAMNNDKRKIAQEYELAFLGSGDNVIPTEILKKAEQCMIKEPIEIDKRYKKLFYYRKYNEDHKYILASDVSSGSSDDSSAFTIIDVDDMVVAAEFCDKIPSDELAKVINHAGLMYGSPLVVVDVTGGYGETTTKTLKNTFDYTNIYTKGDHNGLYISTTLRPKLIDNFRVIISNNEFPIESIRLLEELLSFVYVNGRADHKRSGHDDIIFCYVIAFWIIVNDFRQLAEAEKTTKQLMETMTNINTEFNKINNPYFNPDDPYFKYSEFLR